MKEYARKLSGLSLSESELLKRALAYAIDFADEFWMGDREEIIELAKKIYPSVPESFWRVK